jgi:hypothetical protein
MGKRDQVVVKWEKWGRILKKIERTDNKYKLHRTDVIFGTIV